MDIARLQYITQTLPNHSHAELAAQACAGGVRWVQLRVKQADPAMWYTAARETQRVCQMYGATFILNDNVEMACELGADGVHLGKQDMPAQQARTVLGNNAIIGGTANTFGDILALADARVDYIGLGPFRFTTTKEKLSPILGIEGYAALLQQCREHGIGIPIVAIGGILYSDVTTLLQTGIYGVAVSSAIGTAERPAHAAEQFFHELERQLCNS